MTLSSLANNSDFLFCVIRANTKIGGVKTLYFVSSPLIVSPGHRENSLEHQMPQRIHITGALGKCTSILHVRRYI